MSVRGCVHGLETHVLGRVGGRKSRSQERGKLVQAILVKKGKEKSILENESVSKCQRARIILLCFCSFESPVTFGISCMKKGGFYLCVLL